MEKELLPIMFDETTNEILCSSQIELTKAQSYAVKFSENMNKVNELSKALSFMNKENPSDTDIKTARINRLALVKNRTSVESVKKSLKEDILKEGKLIDSLYNVVKDASELTEKEYSDIEKVHENREKKRKEELSLIRWGQLQEFCDPAIYPLGDMSEPDFINLLEGMKLAKEARELQEKKAEEERIEKERLEVEEREKMRLENIRLKEEAEENERLAKIEREKQAEAIAKIEAERKAEAEKARKEKEAQELKLKKEREENERLAKELQAKKDAEALAIKQAKEKADKEEKQRIEDEKKKAKAPEKEKLSLWVNAYSTPEIPNLTQSELKDIQLLIQTKFEAFKTWALKEIEKV